MATIPDDETTPKLSTSILFKKLFKIKGRSFKYVETFPQSKPNTFICKCLGEDDNLEYVIKIVKLNDLENDLLEVSETTLDKNSISDTCVSRHQLGEWKFSETIAKLYSSVVVIYEISEIIGDELVLLSEYRGINLETYGKNKIGTLYLCEVLQIFIGLVNALLLIHNQNIIHRDIKPPNIFINYETYKTTYAPIDVIQVALGDLGIAMKDCKSNNQSMADNSTDDQYNSETNFVTFETTYSKNCGTPGYIAPECENGIYSFKSDIWSLARTMIWLLFIRNTNNSHNIKNLNEFEKKIGEDLSSNDVILKFIRSGSLDNDIKGWREFISILKDMLIERISPIQILERIFKHETIDRPIILKQQFNYLNDNFKNNRSIQFFYIINGILLSSDLIFFNELLRKDRQFILEAVKQNGNALYYADKSLRKDREFILEAVKQNGNALEYADESFTKDREIVLEAVKQNGNALKFADESFKKDREILVNKKRLKTCLRASRNPELSHLPKFITKDREFILEAVKENGNTLRYADEPFRKDRDFVLQAVKQNSIALIYADASFKKDREIVFEAIKRNGSLLRFSYESFKKDREFILEAVKRNGFALSYADESLKKDREIVLEAVKQDGFVLEYADESLKKDREIVLEVVKRRGEAFKYVDESFKKDREFILAVVKQNGGALEYVDESFKKDREIVLEATKHDYTALEYADDSLKKDREFTLVVVKQKRYALKYVDESLKKDREFLNLIGTLR